MRPTNSTDAASRLEGGTPNAGLARTSRALEVVRWLRRLDEDDLAVGDEVYPDRRTYPEVVDLVPGAYVETDVDGVIRQANVATSAMLRVSRDDLVGTSLLELVAPESGDDLKFALKRLRHDDDATGWEMRVQPATGPPLNAFVAVRGGWDEAGNRVLRWLLHDIPGERGRKRRRARRRPSSMVNTRRRSEVSSKSG